MAFIVSGPFNGFQKPLGPIEIGSIGRLRLDWIYPCWCRHQVVQPGPLAPRTTVGLGCRCFDSFFNGCFATSFAIYNNILVIYYCYYWEYSMLNRWLIVVGRYCPIPIPDLHPFWLLFFYGYWLVLNYHYLDIIFLGRCWCTIELTFIVTVWGNRQWFPECRHCCICAVLFGWICQVYHLFLRCFA